MNINLLNKLSSANKTIERQYLLFTNQGNISQGDQLLLYNNFDIYMNDQDILKAENPIKLNTLTVCSDVNNWPKADYNLNIELSNTDNSKFVSLTINDVDLDKLHKEYDAKGMYNWAYDKIKNNIVNLYLNAIIDTDSLANNSLNYNLQFKEYMGTVYIT